MADPFFGDPQAASVGAVIAWLQAAMLGRLATATAVIAVAAIGFGLMSGHLDLRRGIVTVIGCFVLFGASGIAAGFLAAAHFGHTTNPDRETAERAIQPAVPIVRPSADYDPYAGAAMPVQ